MSIVAFGEPQSGSNKTPTLRQLLKAEPDVELPEVSIVTMIFKPGKYPQFGFVANNKFRVSVSEDSPLFNTLLEQIEDVVFDGICLGIRVLDRDIAEWQLVMIETTSVTWESAPFGWVGEEAKSKKKPLAKSPPQSQSESGGDEVGVKRSSKRGQRSA